MLLHSTFQKQLFWEIMILGALNSFLESKLLVANGSTNRGQAIVVFVDLCSKWLCIRQSNDF